MTSSRRRRTEKSGEDRGRAANVCRLDITKALSQKLISDSTEFQMTLSFYTNQGSFPAGMPGNGVPKVTLTVGTAFKPALGELYKSTKIRLFEIQNQKFFSREGHSPLSRPLNPIPSAPRSSRLLRSNSAAPHPPIC